LGPIAHGKGSTFANGAGVSHGVWWGTPSSLSLWFAHFRAKEGRTWGTVRDIDTWATSQRNESNLHL
jgi:hypothetical protein